MGPFGVTVKLQIMIISFIFSGKNMNKSALDISSYCINIPEEGIKISPTHNKIAG